MNNRLITYGRLFRFCAVHHLTGMLQPSPNVRVTYTHEVGDDEFQNFQKNLHYLLQIRKPVLPEDFFDIIDGNRSLDANSFLMTFDDGLLSNYNAAKEILDPLGIKAIFFAPTAILDLQDETAMRQFTAEHIYYNTRDTATLAPKQYQFMKTEHIKELASNGHVICPHTHNHVLLPGIHDDAIAQEEIVMPKKILENLIDKKIRAFSFPVGTEKQVTHFAYKYINEHYDFCFTALNGINTTKTDSYHLHRDCFPSDAPLKYIKMIMDGTYDLYYSLKMNKLKKLSRVKQSRGAG